MPDIELPRINALVEIELADERSYPSRIEDSDGLLLTVAGPRGAGDIDVPEAGDPVTICWTGPRGLYRAPGVMVDVQRRSVTVWRVRVEGVVGYTSRRAAARVDIVLPVKLIDPTTGVERTGYSVNLSERGMRCHIVDADELNLPVKGYELLVHFTMDDEAVQVPGSVVTAQRPDVHKELEIVLELTPEEPIAKQIRRFVIAQQVLARRASHDATG